MNSTPIEFSGTTVPRPGRANPACARRTLRSNHRHASVARWRQCIASISNIPSADSGQAVQDHVALESAGDYPAFASSVVVAGGAVLPSLVVGDITISNSATKRY